MRLTICVWMLCSRGRSPTEQSPDRAKGNERKFGGDKPSQADRRALWAHTHRCPSRFHAGKLGDRLAKSSLSPMQSREPISVPPSPKLGRTRLDGRVTPPQWTSPFIGAIFIVTTKVILNALHEDQPHAPPSHVQRLIGPSSSSRSESSLWEY